VYAAIYLFDEPFSRRKVQFEHHLESTEPLTTKYTKFRGIRWEGERKEIHTGFGGGTEIKRSLGRHRPRCEDNIKIHLK
jgi:hypothetical protein